MRISDPVQHCWWDQEALALVFEAAYETARHYVLVPAGFIETCDDGVTSLRVSELVDDIDEARGQDRRFVVLEKRGAVRERSMQL